MSFLNDIVVEPVSSANHHQLTITWGGPQHVVSSICKLIDFAPFMPMSPVMVFIVTSQGKESNTTITWRPIFEWYVVRYGSKNWHQQNM